MKGAAGPRARLAACLALLIAIGGCTASRTLSTRGGFETLAPGQPITVHAQGDRVYRLRQHTLLDSVIRGSGTLSERGSTADFDGTIPLDQIVAVRTESRSVLRALAVAGITVLFVATLSEAINSSQGASAREGTSYRGPGGTGTSCPYLYVWDGKRYRLEAEPFGIALGRALELTTAHLLPAARAENGVVRLRLTNEREETHYVNALQLRAIELGDAPAAVLDVEGNAWPLSGPALPIAARDESQRDILPLVSAADGRLWECAASSLTADSGYEDVLEMTFKRPLGRSTGLLTITAINTELSTEVYRHLCRLVGDQAALLAHAIETDPELIARLRDYLRDASLEALVWNGRGWESAGAFAPEGSAAPFTRGLRIEVPGGAGEHVRVRLRSMADVWKIDAIAVGWAESEPLPMRSVEMLSATGPAGEDLRETLRADDDRRAILLPPDRIDLTFAAAPTKSGKRVAYAAVGRGYLLEWDPGLQEEPATLLSPMPERRIELLKELLGRREIALRPIYEEWRKIRTQ